MGSGILGMNARNQRYIRVRGSQRNMADDKLQTKELLLAAGIRVPKLYGVIRTIRDFDEYKWNKLPANFVVKPNRGFGGEGILVLKSALKKQEFHDLPVEARVWIKPNGGEISHKELHSHVLGILDGQFSLQSAPDVAFFERRVSNHKSLRDYSPKGVPDVRIVVYNKVPVMAMMRIPTERSGGRANIAQGAIGVGIDIGRGLTTTAMVKVPWRRVIDMHPDTGAELHGFAIPFWDDILKMAVEAQMISKIGFLGVDVVLDQQEGPVMLEINLRPGLDIQVANQDGLATRLERVEGLNISTLEKGIRVSKELFGGETERLVEEVSGRDIIGLIERVKVSNTSDDTKPIEILAKVDTGAYSTSISKKLALKLGFKDVVEQFEWVQLDPSMSAEESTALANKMAREYEDRLPNLVRAVSVRSGNGLYIRPAVRIVIDLSGKKVSAIANITDRGGLRFEMIVGRKQLRRYLIDPMRRDASLPKKKKNPKKDLKNGRGSTNGIKVKK